MKLNFDDHEQLTVVAIKGDLNAESTEALRKAALEKLNKTTRDFVLDLHEMEFIDSKGLESLLWLQDQCGERLGQIRLAGASENFQKVLEMTRLTPRFECTADVEAAIKSLR